MNLIFLESIPPPSQIKASNDKNSNCLYIHTFMHNVCSAQKLIKAKYFMEKLTQNGYDSNSEFSFPSLKMIKSTKKKTCLALLSHVGSRFEE